MYDQQRKYNKIYVNLHHMVDLNINGSELVYVHTVCAEICLDTQVCIVLITHLLIHFLYIWLHFAPQSLLDICSFHINNRHLLYVRPLHYF